ncbi:MAG TPA: glycosyltransferase family 4 protein [Gemmatimonadales bacterium]|nr:glycosyltransferase family 4 protein [Gemmatimonadales bacterium]
MLLTDVVEPRAPSSLLVAASPSAPLTIAMVAACPLPAPRGTPIRILRLAEAMAARGHRVHVVAYHYGVGRVDPAVHLHRIPAVGGETSLRPGPSFRKLARLDPMLTRLLAGLLRREQVDLIHAHHFEGLLVGRAARALVRSEAPLIFDAHTLLTSELPTYGPSLPAWIKRLAGTTGDRWLPPLADHVASCTERIRHRLIEIGAMAPERVTVVPNGVEPRRCASGNTPRPTGTPSRLIFTGNLARYQGIDLMLEAFALVLQRRPDTRLTIVTAGPFDEYEGRARALRIRQAIDLVPASVDEEPALLAEADVALNPRIDCDGIPMKLLNYLAAGRPVVSFAGSAPGLTHRRTAWLAPDGDVQAFAGGILDLLNDARLAQALGERARHFVQTHHTWDRSAALAEEMYRRTLARRHADA